MIYSVPKPVKAKKIKKKRSKKVAAKGLSDGNLLKLHREAVRKIFHFRCFHCNMAIGDKEVHHIVKRKNFLLRYNYRNGVLLCKYVCHQWAETPEGKHKIDQLIAPHRKYLQDRSGSAKQWFVDHNVTREEYCIEMKKELEEILK